MNSSSHFVISGGLSVLASVYFLKMVCLVTSWKSLDIVWCRFLILLVESCSKLIISVTEHLVEVVDKLSTTAVVFWPSPWGRKQFSSISGRQSGFPGRHFPSPWGRKQLSSISGHSDRQAGNPPGSCSPSPWGRKQLSSFSSHSGRQASNCLFPQGRRQSSSFPSLPGRCSPFPWGRKQLSNNSGSSPLPWWWHFLPSRQRGHHPQPCLGKLFQNRQQPPHKSGRQSRY